MIVRRWPKSVIGRRPPPCVGNDQMLMLPESSRNNRTSDFPSGETMFLFPIGP
jgi:hypothetical protein